MLSKLIKPSSSPSKFNDHKLDGLPPRMNRKSAAVAISELFFPVSPRTLEKWPIKWLVVNGHAIADTTEILGHAEQMLAAAVQIRRGKR